jgi:hypothetical protein
LPTDFRRLKVEAPIFDVADIDLIRGRFNVMSELARLIN